MGQIPPAQYLLCRRFRYVELSDRVILWILSFCSQLSLTRVALHLVQIHQVWANYPNVALREHLDPGHPVRLLLSPFYYRSAMVARKSIASLVPSQGMFDD